MIFFAPRGWVIFYGSERLGDFYVVPRGWVIFFPKRFGDFFGPKRLGNFLGPKRLGDFFLYREVG